MSRSSGVAIWSESLNSPIRIHVNFWKFDSKAKEDCHFLDIGILLQDIKFLNSGHHDQEIKIYFPFKIQEDTIEDLYNRIIIKGSIYEIFNKPDLKLITNESQNYAEIINLIPDKNVYAALSKIEISPTNSNIIIIALSKNLQEEDYAYFRIRINLDDNTQKQFSQKFRPTTSFLLPSFNEIEHVSFNINERRSLPPEISPYLAKNGLEIQTVDFFLVRESEASLLSQYSPFKRCRELEHGIWSSYLPANAKNFDKKLAYHWQEKTKDGSSEPIEHFGAFAKFSYNNDGIKVLIIYLTVALFLGVLAGTGGNLLSDLNTTSPLLDNYVTTSPNKNPLGFLTVIFILLILILKTLQLLNIKKLFRLLCKKIKSCSN